MDGRISPERAEILALEALAWLASDSGSDAGDGMGGLARFLAVSGVEADDLRAAVGRPELAAAVLDFLLANEDLLVKFCDGNGTGPRAVHQARRLLGTGDAERD